MPKSVKLILGPPGTGKTYELRKRVKELMDLGVMAREIAWLSHTKAGTFAGIDILKKDYTLSKEDTEFMSNLHSLVFRQLGLKKTMVMDGEHYKRFGKTLRMNFRGQYTSDISSDDDQYLFLGDLQRQNPEAFKAYKGTFDEELFYFVNRQYARYKEAFGVLDFTDMLERALLDLDALPVHWLIGDEMQDCTPLMWKVIHHLFSDANWILAGDDDQAIFEWAGASVDHLLSQAKGEDVTVLEKSHRLPDNLIQVPLGIKSQMKTGYPKRYHGKEMVGEYRLLSRMSQLTLEIVSTVRKGETWLLLARTRAALNRYKDELDASGLLFEYDGEQSLDPRLFEFVKAYNERKAGKLPVVFDEKRLSQYVKDMDAIEDREWFDNCLLLPSDIFALRRVLVKNGDAMPELRIKAMTVHKAKGLEADNVCMLMDTSKRITDQFHRQVDSEHRVMYVALSRMKKRLFVIPAEGRHSYPLFDFLMKKIPSISNNKVTNIELEDE